MMDPMQLPLKPFEQMTAGDYAAIGLKCGLEVHQQLLTRRKLFCRCPAGHYSSDFDARLLRHMRPTLSEMGEYDGTALMEKKTRKNIIYHVHHATVCTYEFDDTPPFPMDDDAIDIAMKLALMLRLTLVNELHIARKQYLDGSIPAGFQRTTILGVDGWLPYKERRIGVRQLGLEEDSCRELYDRGHDRGYLTDRLGTPLIEVVTEPDMRTPQETAEVCDIIGRLCRSTGNVRRGYGATRQDVNVSVAGGTRIEIKGVPQIWRIPRLIYNEASRQVGLLQIRDSLRERGINPDTLRTPMHDVTDAFGGTSYEPIRSAVDAGLRVRCVVLPGFAGLLGALTQEHTTFAKEFSDRVRVIACLTKLPNIAHSDAPADSLSAAEWRQLRQRVGASDRDTLILVWGDDQDTTTACQEIEIRACQAATGIPSDTRQPMTDGTNGFERVLPGAERMYPDTDMPPIELTTERLRQVRRGVPEFFWDTEHRFRTAGMVEDDVRRLAICTRSVVATRAIEDLGLSAVLLGVVLSQRLRAMGRSGFRPDRLTNDALETFLKAHADGRVTRDGLAWLIAEILQRRTNDTIIDEDVLRFLDQIDMKPATDQDVDAAIERALETASPGRFATDAKRRRFVMGRLMGELIGRIDGATLLERLDRKLQAVVTA
jgi:glutamyl-tRNA(Gln) amidotransferase subunit E